MAIVMLLVWEAKPPTLEHNMTTDNPRNTSLNDLFYSMLENHPTVTDCHGQWRSDLPTFGGTTPDSTIGVWSWDADCLLIGTCAEDLETVARTA